MSVLVCHKYKMSRLRLTKSHPRPAASLHNCGMQPQSVNDTVHSIFTVTYLFSAESKTSSETLQNIIWQNCHIRSINNNCHLDCIAKSFQYIRQKRQACPTLQSEPCLPLVLRFRSCRRIIVSRREPALSCLQAPRRVRDCP